MLWEHKPSGEYFKSFRKVLYNWQIYIKTIISFDFDFYAAPSSTITRIRKKSRTCNLVVKQKHDFKPISGRRFQGYFLIRFVLYTNGVFPGCEYFLAVSCELVNHCSDNGACSGPNECTCYSGYKGRNCSESMYTAESVDCNYHRCDRLIC